MSRLIQINWDCEGERRAQEMYRATRRGQVWLIVSSGFRRAPGRVTPPDAVPDDRAIISDWRRCANAARLALLKQTVPDSGFRHDVAGSLRVDLELGAKLADDDAQILGVVAMPRSPNLGKGLPMGDDPASMGRQ